MARMTSRIPPHVSTLVDEQVRRWNLAQQARRAALHWPIITVSREFGSLGAATAERVASRLGFRLWDQEVVHAIAEESGASAKLVASLDEHTRSGLEDLISGALLGVAGTTDGYVRELARVFHTISSHGGAVVVGRGAQWVVPADKALRVRVVCPLDKRVAGYAQRKGIAPKDAEKIVRDTERDRRTFFQQRFGRDVTDPTFYDLLINTGTFDVDATAELIVTAYRQKFPGLPEARVSLTP